MKKIFLLIAYVFLSNIGYSQTKDTIYLNASYKEIAKTEFQERIRSNLFYTANIKGDSVFYMKLRYKQYYGKLESSKKNQLNKIFASRFQIDTTKTWLIHYIDTLFKKSINPKLKHIRDRDIFMDSVCYINLIRNIDYSVNKKTRKFKKFKKTELIHFYGFNKGYPIEEIEYGKWYKDQNKIVKKIFNDGIRHYNTIIIFPNGDFCLDPWPIQVKRILNRRGYLKEKKNWLKGHYNGPYNPSVPIKKIIKKS